MYAQPLRPGAAPAALGGGADVGPGGRDPRARPVARPDPHRVVDPVQPRRRAPRPTPRPPTGPRRRRTSGSRSTPEPPDGGSTFAGRDHVVVSAGDDVALCATDGACQALDPFPDSSWRMVLAPFGTSPERLMAWGQTDGGYGAVFVNARTGERRVLLPPGAGPRPGRGHRRARVVGHRRRDRPDAAGAPDGPGRRGGAGDAGAAGTARHLYRLGPRRLGRVFGRDGRRVRRSSCSPPARRPRGRPSCSPRQAGWTFFFPAGADRFLAAVGNYVDAVSTDGAAPEPPPPPPPPAPGPSRPITPVLESMRPDVEAGGRSLVRVDRPDRGRRGARRRVELRLRRPRGLLRHDRPAGDALYQADVSSTDAPEVVWRGAPDRTLRSFAVLARGPGLRARRAGGRQGATTASSGGSSARSPRCDTGPTTPVAALRLLGDGTAVLARYADDRWLPDPTGLFGLSDSGDPWPIASGQFVLDMVVAQPDEVPAPGP